jgi:hydroxymethylpyrimidine/phosphomethylpyrimidine kinase
MKKNYNTPKVLTIAGSDSGGGAGIQADLKTFCAFNIYGMSVITSVTAQNTLGVQHVFDLPAQIIEKQLDSVLSDLGADAVKTGMLSNIENIEVIVQKLMEYKITNLIVDPVMMATTGKRLLCDDALTVLKMKLLPIAKIITPNIPEAEQLTGFSIHSIDDMKQAAEKIYKMGCPNALVKGGHLTGDAVDILFNGSGHIEYRNTRIDAGDIHGTGCSLSAAIAAGLARGADVSIAVERAKDYISKAIRQARQIGGGMAVLNHDVSVHPNNSG